jgi:pyridoxine 5-phosphate synthase
MVEGAAATGTDRIELYTERYARDFGKDPAAAVRPFREAAETARRCGLGLNAGHDLNLRNLAFFVREIPWIEEVSIGHALVCDAIYYGLENTVQMYRRALHQ